MNGNTPYAGTPTVTQAGKRATTDIPEPSPEQLRQLREDVFDIAAETRAYLPDGYAVDADIDQGVSGPQVRIAVRPPAGRPVSAGFTPEPDDLEAGRIVDEADRQEVARGLAASAALQVKQAISSAVTPTAR